MTLALVQKTLQLVLHAYAAHGDTSRTPGIAVVPCEYLCGFEHIVEIVHRLSLTHEDDVCKCLSLRQGIYLIEYVGSCEVTLKTLLTRLTEQTVHLTTHLT